jgi:hypothetical protein
MKISKNKVLAALEESLRKIPRNQHQLRADKKLMIETTKALLKAITS